MPLKLSIPRGQPAGPLTLTADVGQMLFILGANGTGKSSLMQHIARTNHKSTRRIAAHRQTWFDSGSPDLTGKKRSQIEETFAIHDQQESARWKDDKAKLRTEAAIYDLIDSENRRSREIARAVDEDNVARVAELRAKEAIFTIVNRIFRLSNLDIHLSIANNDEIVATRGGSTTYSVAELSDGERNALLIAANVLTVPPGTLLLIDEPERHLHRSIISPLLSLLLRERRDCAFVVSTHEPMLPVDNPGSKVLLTRACVYKGERVASYDIDLLEDTDAIDDDLKRTILGERRKIVFVEGVEHSLDKPLYSVLFPNASVVPKNSCRDVVNAVLGIKGTAELHWVKPFGLVDNDTSEPERIRELHAKGVIPLNVYSVESVYYHPDVQKLACEKLASVLGGDPAEKLKLASEAAIKAIRENAEHLSNRIAEKAARARVFSLLPRKGEVARGGKRSEEIDFGKIAADESARLGTLIDASDFVGVLQRYPVRESKALDAIAKAIGYADRSLYETAVRKILADNNEAVNSVRVLLGNLPAELVS